MGYNPICKWINPTYPIYNWGYNPLTKWDEPPSSQLVREMVPFNLKIKMEIYGNLLLGEVGEHN